MKVRRPPAGVFRKKQSVRTVLNTRYREIMEIQQVRYFLSVCLERNFTRAAKKCSVSQPSLTRAIKLLETEFQGSLFIRGNGGVNLTELGRTVRPYLENVWNQASAIKKITADLGEAKGVELRLGVMSSISPELLMDVAARFQAAHPALRFDVISGNEKSLAEGLINSSLDVAILARSSPHQRDRCLECTELFLERMMIVVSATHKLAELSRITLADVVAEKYIERTYRGHDDRADDYNDGLSAKAFYKSDRHDWVMGMIAKGFGFGYLPEPEYRSMDEVRLRASKYIKDERLKIRFIDRAIEALKT